MYKYISVKCPKEIIEVAAYLDTLGENLSADEQDKLAILLWKSLPGKAIFSQNLALHIINNLAEARASFIVPAYIKAAFKHLRN
ncbi:MAG: hypothetical protein JST21_00075 [Bacteroidetes bacterium]|nr:hypothetical protein [Bacteroidota bacterium]